MGVGASMLWWEEGFCRMLAERGRFVLRYDHRADWERIVGAIVEHTTDAEQTSRRKGHRPCW